MDTQKANEILESFQKKELFLEEKSREEQIKIEKEHEFQIKRYYQEMMPHLQFASQDDYLKWLRGFLENGGKITHFYDYMFPDGFHKALRGFNMIPLCGSSAVQIIVPKGVEITSFQGLGHCDLYLMDGFKVQGGWVPIYKGMKFKDKEVKKTVDNSR